MRKLTLAASRLARMFLDMGPRNWRLRAVAAVAVVVAATACGDSPFEPTGTGERVPIGRVIEDATADGVVRRYTIEASADETFAVFLEAMEGTVYLAVQDSVTLQLVAQAVADPATGDLEENATASFGGSGGSIYLLSFVALPSGAAARFRFLVYRVKRGPEHRPTGFAIGDTVAGETIDPIADLDAFVVRGQQDQEIVAVAEPVGAGSSGTLGLWIRHAAAGSYLGQVLAAAGVPAASTTGRVRLPATGDYVFELISALAPGQRFRGAYRFWSYAINRAPERLPVAAPLGSEVSGEAIDLAGDVDEFTLQGVAGAELNAFLQAGRAHRLEVALGSGPAIAVGTAEPGDTGLFHRATGRFRLAQTGTYTLRVMGSSPALVADTGSFRFFIYPIDRRPEHVAELIPPGDTVVGEAIDRPGDVDEFTIPGAAGDEFNALFRATSGSSAAILQLEAVDGAGNVVRAVQSLGTDTSLFQRATGRFVLTTAGTYRLRVSGALDTGDRDAGPYRLFLYKVNRAPEAIPATLSFGDSISGEAIDLPGDVDEFRVVVPESSGSSLVVRLGSEAGNHAMLTELIDSTTGQVLAGAVAGTGGAYGHQSTFELPAGAYLLRVRGTDVNDRSLLRSSYVLWLNRFRFGPEAVGDTLAVGDTVSGEAIEPLGDADVFVFHGMQGQHVNVAFQGTAPSITGGLQAYIDGAFPLSIAFVQSPTSADSLGASQSNRIDLPVTGWYRIRVASWESPNMGIGDRGPYRLALTARTTGPEQASETLVPGDSVTAEAIDLPGDWDEYTLTSTPGQLLAIVGSRPVGSGYPALAVFDPASHDTLAWVVLEVIDKRSPRFTIPASGRLKVAVFERRGGGGVTYCSDPTCGGVYALVSGYRFTAFPVNPAPESVPSAFALGDTVRGEALETVADVDEFFGTGIPGDLMSVWVRLQADPVPAGGFINISIVDPASGATLRGGFSLIASSPTGSYHSPGAFAVPAGGTYLVRVETGASVAADPLGTAPYEFFAKRGS